MCYSFCIALEHREIPLAPSLPSVAGISIKTYLSFPLRGHHVGDDPAMVDVWKIVIADVVAIIVLVIFGIAIGILCEWNMINMGLM